MIAVFRFVYLLLVILWLREANRDAIAGRGGWFVFDAMLAIGWALLLCLRERGLVTEAKARCWRCGR